MKITVEIDCTPEEARRAIGIPDPLAIQESYARQLAGLGDAAAGAGVKPEALEALVKGWLPMGEAGLGLWRALTEAAARGGKDEPR